MSTSIYGFGKALVAMQKIILERTRLGITPITPPDQLHAFGEMATLVLERKFDALFEKYHKTLKKFGHQVVTGWSSMENITPMKERLESLSQVALLLEVFYDYFLTQTGENAASDRVGLLALTKQKILVIETTIDAVKTFEHN